MNIALISIASLASPKEAARITLINIAKQLATKGHKVFIIAEKAPGLPECENVGGTTIYRPYKFLFPGKLISPALALRKLQKKELLKFDVIHGFSATPLFAISIFITRLVSPKAKTINTLRGYSRDKWGNKGYFFLNLADKITVPTSVFKNKLKSVKNKKIIVLRSPIDLDRFFPQNKELLKEKYGYGDKKIILYYGAVWKNKGANNLLKAIPSVIKDYPKALFLFLPRYNNIPEQIKLINKLKIENYLKIITEEVKIEDYVNLADIVALPYINLLGTEGNPSCLLEAMACKTAVVTSNLPELKEIAEGSAIMAISNDVPSLAEKISFALKQPSSEMIKNAYLKTKEFDAKKICEKIESIYTEITLS